MSLVSIGVKQAEEIAIEFLQQNYSSIRVVKSFLKNDGRIWVIEIMVSSFDKTKNITVIVNARTGLIQGYQ